ncbi:MAG: hypothetical protein GX774_09655 [Armatimonadetes bacterium]|nr:hypothetical protein [Armatimonadota bacterium]
MLQQTLLTDSDCEQIRDAVLRTLERVGMMIQNAQLREALERAGARVDHAAERAWFPPALVTGVLEALRAAHPAPAEAPRRVAPGLPTLGVQVAQFYLDWAKRERRPGNRQDFLTMIRLGDVIAAGDVGHALLMTDVPPLLEPLEAVALLCEHARRPGYTYPHHVEQFEYLAEIGEIWEGRRDRFLIGGVFLTSPLRLCRRAADFLAWRVSRGMECGLGTMACVGASVPVTLAGAITVTAAEVIGTWVAMKALRPETPVGVGLACGSVDMRSGNASYCSPEAMLLNFGTREFLQRVSGVTAGISGADDYCDAKFPGLAAAMEKALKAMTIAAYTGIQPGVGEGMLESGKTLSPEQLLIEREVTEHVRRLAQPLSVSPETLALEAIEEVGFGAQTTYLNCEHTLRHFREALWHPRLLDRTVWHEFAAEAQGETKLVERAHQQFQELLAAYQPPQPDPEKLKAIRAVIDQAKRNLQAVP